MNAPWMLDDRMTVVLFAGMGGGCDGLEAAGFHVHLAVNHDPLAIAVHKARHPHTRHLSCDVFEVEPRQACGGRGVRILHASPDCTHFSVAKGSKPVSRRRRSLAWVVPRWCGTVRPEVVTLENVREITTWGPLVCKRDPATGRCLRLDGTIAAKGERIPVEQQWLVPDPRHKGRIWRAWLRHMRRLGYSFEHRTLCCADFGIPTIRTRLFGVARADGGSIAWPVRTHAPRDKAKALRLRPWVGADTILDWSLPMRSIFGRDKPLAEATLRRIARGVMRYVIEPAARGERPFIVPITHAGDTRTHAGRDPLPTQTTAHRGEHAIVAAHLTKFRPGLAGAEATDPLPTYTSNSFHKRPGGAPPLGLAAVTMVQTGYGERQGQAPRTLDLTAPLGTQVDGSKAAVVAAFLAQHNNDSRRIGGVNPGRQLDDPISTITATAAQQGLAAVTLGSLRGTSRDGQDFREPLPAQSAGGNHELRILPFLQAYYSSGGQDQDARDPLLAVTAKARHGLVTVEIDGQTMVITDILMRMLDPLEGARAHGFDPASLLHEIEVTDKRGRKVCRKPNKTELGHLVGNSVPPRMVQLLAEANGSRAIDPAMQVAAE